MHVVIDFDVLYHLAAVSLESAVEIVQIDAGEFARRGVKELRREVFRQATNPMGAVNSLPMSLTTAK